MGKAPEAVNDVAMCLRVARHVGRLGEGAERLAERAGALLVGQRLAVLER